jgi:vacuolar protein sorting-associated protein 13A/C
MRPEELFVGMARGGGSLLKHTVGGVAHSFSQITGTFSKNLSTLSMDRDYKVV